MIYYPADKRDADARRVFNLLDRIVPRAQDGIWQGNVFPCRDADGNECVRLWLCKEYDGKHCRHCSSGKLPQRLVPVSFYRRQMRKLAARVNRQVRLHRWQVENDWMVKRRV